MREPLISQRAACHNAGLASWGTAGFTVLNNR